MTAAIEDYFPTTDKRIPMGVLIAGLQDTLRRNHEKILEAARSDWQNSYGACDPSDACVTIRIAAAGSQEKRRSAKRKRTMRWGC